jgi:6-phosphogluconolactonase
MPYLRILLCLLLAGSVKAQDSLYYLFIGTYTSGKSEGIYVYRFNNHSGTAEKVSSIAAPNPSYLALAGNGTYLYAVNQNGENNVGELSAFSFDKKTGSLQFINKQPTHGDRPCYISVDSKRKWAIVANYASGNLTAFPILRNGSLDTAAQLIVHSGKGFNLKRQDRPHIHTAVFSPNEKYLLSTDLGIDQINIHRFNPRNSQPLSEVHVIKTTPGSGPRHLAFHPNGKWLYAIEELSGFISVFDYYPDEPVLLEHLDAYPPGYKGERGGADIHISPDGKFLYASNRFDANNLAIFSIHPRTGKLQLVGHQPVLGKTPRNFMIDPTGRFVLVANQDSDNVVIFKRDTQTGLLQELQQLQVPNPVCLKMTPVK